MSSVRGDLFIHLHSTTTFHYQRVVVVEGILGIELSTIIAVTMNSVITEMNAPERGQVYVQE